jgi:hypothetical protein
VGDLAHLLTQICFDSPVNYGDQEHEPGPFGANAAPQAEHNQALIFGHHAYRACQEQQADDEHRPDQAGRYTDACEIVYLC